jgi:hypothetical protein
LNSETRLEALLPTDPLRHQPTGDRRHRKRSRRHQGEGARHFADRIKAWTGFDPIRSLADVERAGAEVAKRGFKGLKTNIMLFDGPTPRIHMSGFNGNGCVGFGPLFGEDRIRWIFPAVDRNP